MLLRLTCVLFLFTLACLLAGVYGMVHNQISYSISPEYFTKFKFAQFNIDPAMPERMGAAYVGWQATWWMGIVIGIFVIPFGLLIRNTFEYCTVMLRVFAQVLLTAIGFGMLGLAFSYLASSPVTTDVSFRSEVISNPIAFSHAAAMHNSSYAGGLVGIFVGMASILRYFLKSETGSAKLW